MTQTPDVVEARASVFEFLLINHPLDCPVCDKGGECPLQDFSYSYGPEREPDGVPAPRVRRRRACKADVDFGPTLMLNRNRCILCTRCVRFMKEIDTDAQIGITDRGYGSEIATFQEEGVHSLLSGNLMDVCPVGAITTKDYRFKSRPWDNPEAVDTICTLCEKGCNTTAWIKAKPEWAKGAQLIRTTPRYNPEVNDYWMCDIGRFDYRWIEGDERLQRPLLRSEAGDAGADRLDATRWRRSPTASRPPATAALRFLISAHASLEELFLIGKLGGAFGLPEDGVAISWRTRVKPQPPRVEVQDSAGRRAERQRREGSRLPGQRRVRTARRTSSAFRTQVEAGEVSRRSTCSIPAPTARSATCRGSSRRSAVRQAAAPDRPGRADDRAREGRRHRPAGHRVGREGRGLREQRRTAAGRRARDHGAGRRAGRLAGLRQPRAGARACRSTTRAAPQSARSSRRRSPGTNATPAWRTSPSRARSPRSTGCRRRTRRSAGSGTSCSRTCRR